MITVKIPGLKSWFDPNSRQALQSKLVTRLQERMLGRDGVFITLTYRHQDYSSPRDLYRCQSERQDVPLFIRRLSRYLGCSLTGKWLRKMEFQKGGWVHFHLVLDYKAFIPQYELERLWGYGHTWINQYKPGHSFYMTKYISKSGDFPDWLLFEKPRSVKIISVSKGFWSDTQYRKRYYKSSTYAGMGAYQPIYFRLQKYRNSTLVKFSETIYKQYDVHISTVVLALRFMNLKIVDVDGVIGLECSVDEFDCAIALAAELRPSSDSSKSDSPVHLINSRKPDAPPWLGLFSSLPEFGFYEILNKSA